MVVVGNTGTDDKKQSRTEPPIEQHKVGETKTRGRDPLRRSIFPLICVDRVTSYHA